MEKAVPCPSEAGWLACLKCTLKIKGVLSLCVHLLCLGSLYAPAPWAAWWGLGLWSVWHMQVSRISDVSCYFKRSLPSPPLLPRARAVADLTLQGTWMVAWEFLW